MIRFVLLTLLAALCASASLRAHGADRLAGRLLEAASDRPVAGAVVSVVGGTATARTDEEGRFTLAPVPAVPFQLVFVLAGGQVARPVVIHAVDETGDTVIRVSAITDESITVLGAAPSVESAPAAATSVLSATQIASRAPGNLVQALETVPGVNQVSEGHAAVPAVRGLAHGRTLVLIDGARVTAERRVGPGASFLDPVIAEGIDVARGPGSVAYGSDALGGVISVRTKRAEPGSPLRLRFAGTLGARVPEARGALEVSKGFERGGILVQAHARQADDYESPGGPVPNSGWEDRGALVHVTHGVAGGFLSAAWQVDHARDVGRPRNNSPVVRFFYPFENSHRLTASYERGDVAGFRRLGITGFVGTYEQRTDQDRVPTATAGRMLERADVSAGDFHVKGSAERVVGSVRLDLGIDVNGRYGLHALDVVQTFTPDGDPARDVTNVSIDTARRTDTGAYAEAEVVVAPIARLSAGIRGDRVVTRNSGGHFGDRSTAHEAVSGFGAVTIAPARRVSVTAQVSHGFRDPVLSDRYYRGPTGRGFITGNPDLEPETSLQVDVATRYTTTRLQAAVYLYHYRLSELIERYQAAPDLFLFRNRGRARLRGVEVEGRADLGNGYSVEASANIARGRALDDGADLDDVAPDAVSVLGRKDFGGRIHAQLRVAVYAGDARPGPTEVATPGATLLDLGGGWQVAPRLEMRGAVRNVLDEAYYASPDPRWVLAPGRSVSVTAVVTF